MMSDSDKALIDDLKLAEDARLLFRELGFAIELWEALRLARTEHPVPCRLCVRVVDDRVLLGDLPLGRRRNRGATQGRAPLRWSCLYSRSSTTSLVVPPSSITRRATFLCCPALNGSDSNR